MSVRTIQSPGVEIREKNFSQTPAELVGDTFAITGYFAKGNDLEPTVITSESELNTLFGLPTNEAERYSYYTAKEVLDNGANVIISKIPYANDMAGRYKAIGLTIDSDTVDYTSGALELNIGLSGYNEITLSDGTITETQYDQILAGEQFSSVFGSLNVAFADDDFVIIGDTKDVMSNNDKQGLFVTLVDYSDGLAIQDYLSTDPTANTITFTGSDFNFNNSDLSVSASALLSSNSISELIMSQFPSINTDEDGNVNTDKQSHVGIIVGKTYSDSDNEGKIGISILESFVGSLNPEAKNIVTGRSDYILDYINAGSFYIKMIKNTTLGHTVTVPTTGYTYKRALTPDVAKTISFISTETVKDITRSTLISGLDNVLNKLSNYNEYIYNYIVDAGLSTIAQFASTAVVTPGDSLFEPKHTTFSEITSSADVEQWKNIVSKLVYFCEREYKFAMALVDTPRNLTLSGDLKIIRKTNPDATFTTVIASKLKYLTGVSSTYGVCYANWVKIIDSVSGISFWAPQTVKAVGAHAYTHITAEMFNAPAGLINGIMTSVIDLSFNPSDKDGGKLYTKSFNFAKKRPSGAYTVEGQRTLTTTPSALREVQVRYTFLTLERFAYDSSQRFVYQPNNIFTRTQWKDVLETPLKRLKNIEGVYDYLVVCDSSNNTGDVISQNEMKAFIGISPVKTGEFLIVDFVAVPYGATISEYVKYT